MVEIDGGRRCLFTRERSLGDEIYSNKSAPHKNMNLFTERLRQQREERKTRHSYTRLQRRRQRCRTTKIGPSLSVLAMLGCSLFLSTTRTSFLLSLLPLVTASERNPTLDEPFQTSFERLPHAPCVTLFHRSGRIGCGTYSRDTQTGRLLYWTSVVSSSSGSTGSSNSKFPPYVAVMTDDDYTANNVELLLEFANSVDQDGKDSILRGILVLNVTSDESSSSSSSSYYSPESQYPQGQDTPSSSLTVGANYAWNANNGDGLIMKNMYGLPTVYISSQSVAEYIASVSKDQGKELTNLLKDGGELDNDDLYPTIVAEFNYYMGPDDGITSKECLSWKDTDGEWRPKCLPLGGNSIWAVAGSPEVINENEANDNANRRRQDQAQRREIVMLGTKIDSTSMFHDLSTGANSAASNILSLLMAAKLLGSNVNDETLDGLTKRIMFGFFQAESFGFVGSRNFFRDAAYPGFECDEGRTVPSIAKNKNEDELSSVDMACLNPLRPHLAFMDLGSIAGMISVDQVGVLSTDQTFYVHGDGNNDDDDGNFDGFLVNVLKSLSTDDWTIESSSAEAADGDDENPLPPTPLTSLIKLSGGAVGGAVLAGYDAAFADGAMYHSHMDSAQKRDVNMEAIATAATVLARAALASAYYDGNTEAENAAEYAAGIIPALDSDDETLATLSDCLLRNGNCELLLRYGKMEQVNTREEIGSDLGLGGSLGSPPSYYPSVYDASNGQPFVRVGSSGYGSYTGDDYGKQDTDYFATRPSLLEMSIRGMLNDFLGRGSSSSNDSGGDGGRELEDTDLVSCGGNSDCSGVPYCTSSGDKAVCTGGKVCVCSRSYYHVALDEALLPAPNNYTGYFLVRDDDEGVSAMYTEPYWSASVGVGVYRDAGNGAGNWALGAGFILAACCVGATVFLKRRLKKEKLY